MTALYFLLATVLVAAGALSLRGSRFAAFGRAFAMLVLFYGLLIKPLFVALDLPSKEFVDDFVLAPLSESEYWSGSVALLGCYALFIGSMVFTAVLLQHTRHGRLATQRLRFSPVGTRMLTLLGLAGVAVFFAQNIDLLYGASKNVLATDDLADYRGSGPLRLLTSVLYFIPFLMLVNIAGGYRVRGSYVLLWISALGWVAFGFFSDQRGIILFSVFSWLIAYHMFVGPMSMRHVLLASVLAAVMVLVRTVLRLVTEDAGLLVAANEIIGNYIGRNLVENGKTLIIIRSIPELLPHANGGSYLDAVTILLPRALFVDKQTVNLDTIVGMSVFGCELFGACGVPPGLIAESYLNFGVVGVLVAMVACGWLTAWFDWKATHGGVLFKLFYAASLMYFALSVLGSSVSSFITQAIMHALVLLLAYHALRRFVRPLAHPQLTSRTAP